MKTKLQLEIEPISIVYTYLERQEEEDR